MKDSLNKFNDDKMNKNIEFLGWFVEFNSNICFIYIYLKVFIY